MNDSTQDNSQPNNEGKLVAPLTSWAWRRSLFGLVFILGVAVWFLVDGAIFWPKKDRKIDAALNTRAQLEENFASGSLDLEGFYEQWNQTVIEYGVKEDDALIQANQRRKKLDSELKKGEKSAQKHQQEWSQFLQENSLSNPSLNAQVKKDLQDSRKGEKKYREQFYWAAGCGVLAIVYGVMLLRRRGQKLILDEHGLHMPKGELIKFEQIKRLDQRKWHAGKAGLAFLYYEDKSGKTQRAILDGMKYGGFEAAEGQQSIPEQMLERITAHEHIEILDFANEEEEELEKPEEQGQAPK